MPPNSQYFTTHTNTHTHTQLKKSPLVLCPQNVAAKHVKCIRWMRRPELIQPLGPFGGRYPMHFLMALQRLLLHQFPSHTPPALTLSVAHAMNIHMHLIKVLVAGSSSESIHVACIDTRQRKSPVQLTTPPTSKPNRTERNSSGKPFGQYHPPSESCWRKLLFGQ